MFSHREIHRFPYLISERSHLTKRESTLFPLFTLSPKPNSHWSFVLDGGKKCIEIVKKYCLYVMFKKRNKYFLFYTFFLQQIHFHESEINL